MNKFVKFVFGVATGAAAGFGAYCLYKNVIAKKNAEELDDIDDCFDEDETEVSDENREYVSINITEEEPVAEETEVSEEVEETEVSEEVEETEASEEVEEK